MGKRVLVIPYDEGWSGLFELERIRLASALGSAAIRVHHIGSTSVPGLCAKPVIDVLVESPDLTLIDDFGPSLEALGYVAKGEHGIAARRYFSRTPGKGLKVHVHAYRYGDRQVVRHLRFRDYLRAHPLEASRYGELKRSLAIEHPSDRDAYQRGKADYIRQVDARASDGQRAEKPPER